MIGFKLLDLEQPPHLAGVWGQDAALARQTLPPIIELAQQRERIGVDNDRRQIGRLLFDDLLVARAEAEANMAALARRLNAEQPLQEGARLLFAADAGADQQ